MNLPVILDIVIGLIFIYLSLSLLATEIQEMIATVLQWRAEHLKKSIEVLISGGSDTITDEAEFQRIKNLANLIYDNPIVNDLNQEAKGPLSKMFRNITHQIGGFYRRITKTENVFGNKSSGPSYIASASFSSSLLDTLRISPLIKSITESRLERFKDRQLAEVKFIVDNLKLGESVQPILDMELTWLQKEFNKIVEDFKKNQAPLSDSIDRISEKLGIYVQNSQVYLPESELAGRDFQWQMGFLKSSLDSEFDRKVLLVELQPSLSNFFNSIRKTRETQETVQEIVDAKEDSPIYKEIQEIINSMPESLKKSLYILAKRAENDTVQTDQNFSKFQQEIEAWFDRSMERAGGVYKRNARGVALLIGTTIAIATNSDTLYIVGNLSTDSLMRATVNKYADEVVTRNSIPNRDNFAQIQTDVNQALEQLSLPIGWNSNNLKNQEFDGREWPLFSKRIFGWILSGIAISMGAAFWYDLLNKIINVRNVGKKPPSSTDNPS